MLLFIIIIVTIIINKIITYYNKKIWRYVINRGWGYYPILDHNLMIHEL